MTRIKISVTIPKNQVEWIDKLIAKKVFFNRSHAIELAVDLLIKDRTKP